MTNNKMPVLGQKYRVVSYPHKEKVVITMSDFIYFDDGSHIIPEYFWNVFEEIPNNSQKPQIIDELHISGRGLCFVVKKDRDWKIGDTIEKDGKEYVVTGIDSGRENLGLIVRENLQKPSEVQVKESVLSDEAQVKQGWPKVDGEEVTVIAPYYSYVTCAECKSPVQLKNPLATNQKGFAICDRCSKNQPEEEKKEDLKKLTVDCKSLRGELLYNGFYDSIPFPNSAITGDHWYLRMNKYQTEEELDLLVCINDTKNGGEENFLYSQPIQYKEQPKSIWKNVSELSAKKEGWSYNLDKMLPITIGDKFCYLKDFINHIDSLEQRIKKLEEK